MENKTDTIIFTGSFDYYELFMLGGQVVIPLSIYDNNAVVQPFKDNNNHKILLWYSWYNAHHKTADGQKTTDTIINLLYAQNSENYSYTIQEINTIMYYKITLEV